MADYDYILFSPQSSEPGSPAKNEIYYKNSDDRLYLCTDGTGAGGAYSALYLTPQASAPTASRGIVYVNSSDDRLYVCTAL